MHPRSDRRAGSVGIKSSVWAEQSQVFAPAKNKRHNSFGSVAEVVAEGPSSAPCLQVSRSIVVH